jgi:hemerythrin superfamily protein
VLTPELTTLTTRERSIAMSKRDATRRTSRPDAIALLKEDHTKVRRLLAQLVDSRTDRASQRDQLLRTIEQEMKVHTRIEEEIFYPAFRDAAEKKKDDKRLYFEAVEEHHVVDLVLPELKKSRTDSEKFAAKAKVLKDLVEHHAKEEEKEMFPRAKKLMDREELLKLGERLGQAKTVFGVSARSRVSQSQR